MTTDVRNACGQVYQSTIMFFLNLHILLPEFYLAEKFLFRTFVRCPLLIYTLSFKQIGFTVGPS